MTQTLLAVDYKILLLFTFLDTCVAVQHVHEHQKNSMYEI